jgi:glycosyltransferase involved in cell wall biosynthesis
VRIENGAETPVISVVIPVFDEADNLEPLHAEVSAALAKLPPAEIVLVDDGSRDASLTRMQALAARDPRVRVLALDRNHGQSAALDAGFRAARGEITVTLDADLQNDPADIPRLVALLESADCVNGVRADRRDGVVRRLSSRIGNGFRNWVTGEQVTDVGCSLRAMRSRYLRHVKLYRGMHRFLPTLLRIEGARVIEVPVSHRPRHAGRSKYGVGNRLFVGFFDVLAVRWMQSRALRYQVRE